MSNKQPTSQNGHVSRSTMADQARDAASRVAWSAAEKGQEAAEYYVKEPAQDLISLAKDYAKDHPDIAALWAFGLGVFVGWKLKP